MPFISSEILIILEALGYALEQVHDSYIPIFSCAGTTVNGIREYTDKDVAEVTAKILSIMSSLSDVKTGGSIDVI